MAIFHKLHADINITIDQSCRKQSFSQNYTFDSNSKPTKVSLFVEVGCHLTIQRGISVNIL